MTRRASPADFLATSILNFVGSSGALGYRAYTSIISTGLKVAVVPPEYHHSLLINDPQRFAQEESQPTIIHIRLTRF